MTSLPALLILGFVGLQKLPELGCQGALKVQTCPFPAPPLWQSTQGSVVNEIPLHRVDINSIYFQSALILRSETLWKLLIIPFRRGVNG